MKIQKMYISEKRTTTGVMHAVYASLDGQIGGTCRGELGVGLEVASS